MKRLFLFLTIICSILTQSHGQAIIEAGRTTQRPLNMPLYLSGNFGELRPNHFHAGLDFKTQGSSGHPVYAFDDGYLARAAINAYGYGLVLYVAHPSGLTTVYAHLNNFSDSIMAKVLQCQMEQQANNIDVSFAPGQIPIYRGQQIAVSGNTGSSGGPHLHFEVRDTKTGEYYDPMHFFAGEIKDSIPPRIRNIYLYPTAEGVACGKSGVQMSRIIKDKNGQRCPEKRLTAWGKVGLGLKAYDHMNGQNNIYGVKFVRLYYEDTLIYSLQQHSFVHEEHRFTNSLTDYREWCKKRSMVMKCFREPGNKLRMISRAINEGIIDFCEEKPYRFRYELQDAHGNLSTFRFTIHGKKADIPAETEPQGLRIAYGEEIKIDSMGCTFHLAAQNLYTDVDLAFHLTQYKTPYKKLKNGKKQPLSTRKPCSPVYMIGDEYIPMHDYGTLSITLPDTLPVSPDKVYMACLNPSEAALPGELITRESESATAQKQIRASIRTLGKYALCIDTIPPKVSVVGKPTYRQVVFRLTDSDSDIRSWRGTIDGGWVPFDRNTRSQVVVRPQRLQKFGILRAAGISKKKEHIISLTVTDRCGNEKTCTTKVWF